MYSRDEKFQTFLHDLQRYIDTQHIDVSDNHFIDLFIQNPDVQYLLSTWLQQPQNDIQLYHVLIDLPQILNTMNEDEQNFVMEALFKRAHLFRTWIPELTDFDLAIQNIPDDSKDNWSILNRELLTIPEDDIPKLQTYKVWINADILNANTVLDMDQQSHIAFDARIKKIIEENPNLYLTDKHDQHKLVPVMFTDELIARVKVDPVIQNILAQVIHFEPKPIVKPNASAPRNTIEAQATQENIVQNQNRLLDILLGLENTDDESSLSEETINSQQHGRDSSDSTEHTDSDSSQSGHTTEEEHSTSSIPNQTHKQKEASPPKDIAHHSKQYTPALNSPNIRSDKTKTYQDSTPASRQPPKRRTTAQEWNASLRSNPPSRTQKAFYGVVKNNTHNLIYQNVNNEQRWHNYLGPDNGKMPNWHLQWVEMQKKREQAQVEGHEDKKDNVSDSSTSSTKKLQKR